ncbi:MAG TPA: ABC transporter ATP-binding protein [Ktedonobacteraceae bacterium]|nr:ABC transporter ATP-binding protein [Ktedonobacteraceae bacterium]
MSKMLNASNITYRGLLITYLWPQWKRVLFMTILLLSGIALQLINPQLLRYFIDMVTGGGAQTQALLLIGGLFILLALLKQAMTVFTTYLGENVAWIATNTLRFDLMAHCLSLEMAFHKEHTSGELIERIDGDVNTLSLFFSRAVVALLGNGLLTIGILISLFTMDWRIGLAIGIFTLLGTIVVSAIRARAVRYSVAHREKDAEFFSFLGEQLAGTEDMRANGATAYVMRRFYELMRSWLPIRRRSSLGWYSMWSATLIIFALSNALALSLSAYLWSMEHISLGTVYLVFYFTNLLNEPMEEIRSQLQELQRAGAGIVRIRQLLSTQPAIVDGPGQQLPTGALSVEFQKVNFSYTTDKPTLQHIDFRLEAGKVLGILGRTGSGKTTLARLLLRLYDIHSGEIRLGDVPLRATALRELRQHIGMVTQDVQLFHASVRDNLTFFKREIDDQHILEVIEELGLGNWYRSLPEGLDTILGSDGTGLSAGEAQLLAFTRVFLTNPGLVILDEASSRLDPATEQLIERAVSKLLAGRTGIIIAHRLATIARADEIMVLENGCMLEYNERLELAADKDSRFYRLLQTGLEEVLA